MNKSNMQRATPALWASAFLILALIILQAGNVKTAEAEMVSSRGAYSIMTTDSGTEDLLVVIDDRNEQLLAYKVKSTQGVELYQSVSLPDAFKRGRDGVQGRR